MISADTHESVSHLTRSLSPIGEPASRQLLILVTSPPPGSEGPLQDQNRHATNAGRRAELAAFLRAQRARAQPAEFGVLSGPGQRRTPGLRREEVAQLSGVGLTWYTWLEQARDITSSESVIDALARALRMTEDQHRHLRALAALPVPARQPPPGDLVPRLRRLVAAAAPNIASVYDLHFDYLAWNVPYAVTRHDPAELPEDRRNLLWWIFTSPASRVQLMNWDAIARSLIGEFRSAAGQCVGDPRFGELAEALTQASPQFAQWWPDYPVRSFSPATITINNPDVGTIELELFKFHPVENAELVTVLQIPADDDARRRVELLLG